jgi:hypothetical protein
MDPLSRIPILELTILLFVILLAGIGAGFLFGRSSAKHGEQEIGAADTAVKAAVAGLAALLLAFSFSLAANRYDERHSLIVREASAIRDLVLPGELMDEPARDQFRQLIREYLDARVKHLRGEFDNAENARTEAVYRQLQQRIWQTVSQQIGTNKESTYASALMSGVSNLINAETAVEAEYLNTVPWIVLLLLFGAIILTGLLVGHSFGREGRAHLLTALVFAFIATLVVSVILDLDRPRKGTILANIAPLTNLQKTLD